MEAIDTARRALEAASDKQAADIVLLDIRQACSFADYFVICSGDSERQIEAIRQAIADTLEKEGRTPHHCEGTAGSGWVVLDFGDVIVHVFSTFEREYYQLDSLWSKAQLIVKMQ